MEKVFTRNRYRWQPVSLVIALIITHQGSPRLRYPPLSSVILWHHFCQMALGGGGRQKWLSTFTTTRGAFVARATLNCSCGVSLKSVLDFYTVTTPTQVRSLGMKSAQSGCRQVCSFPSFFFCFPHLSLLFSANLCPRHSSHDSFFRLKIRLLSFAQSSLSLPL